MTGDILAEAAIRMDDAVESAKSDFAAVRTGRINPQLFQKIMVDYYGTPTPLAQLAALNVIEARTIMITPYDKGAMKEVETAIRDQPNIGGNPNNDGTVIRVTLPELTEERRRDLVKVVRSRAEDGKVQIRGVRRRAKDDLDALKSEIGEDEVARAEKELDAITKNHVDQVDEALKRKEAELLEV